MDEKYIEMGEAHQEAVTAAARAAVSSQALPDKDLEPHQYKTLVCVEPDCGEPLPELRLKKGRTRCTECESALEQQKRRISA